MQKKVKKKVKLFTTLSYFINVLNDMCFVIVATQIMSDTKKIFRELDET